MEQVLPAPVAQHHLRVVAEVAVDWQVGPLDSDHGDFEPLWIGVVRGLPGGSLPQEEDVGGDRRALPLKRVVRQADGPEEVGLPGEQLADGRILLVEREMAGDHGEDAAGLDSFDGFRDAEIVEGELLAVEVEMDVGERHIADHRVEGREPGIAEVLDADVGLGVEVRGQGGRSGSRARRRCSGARRS